MSQEQEQDQELDHEVDLEGDDADFEIQIEDDTPEEDRGRELLPETDENEGADEDDLGNVGERVKKRIDKLTAEKHDQRRKAEAARREAEEAARAMQILMERERAMRAQLLQYESGFVGQAKGRVEAELSQAKRDFKAAFELGDADAMAEAQEKIARLAPQHEQFSRYRPPEPEREPTYAPVQPQPKAYDPTADQNLQNFMSANPWFNQDQEMTAYAMGLHQQIAAKDPDYVGTPDYYEEIATKVKKAFGKSEEPKRQRTQPVAPAGRGGAPSRTARKKITLTQSQVRLAARLGLTPKQYAESLLEQEKNQ